MRASYKAFTAIFCCVLFLAGLAAWSDTRPPLDGRGGHPHDEGAALSTAIDSKHESSPNPESLARIIMAQANSETPRGKGEQGDKALAGNEAAKQDGQAVPGAVVAVIFGIFGILVVARRRLR